MLSLIYEQISGNFRDEDARRISEDSDSLSIDVDKGMLYLILSL